MAHITLKEAREVVLKGVEEYLTNVGLLSEGMVLQLFIDVVRPNQLRIDPTELVGMSEDEVFKILREKIGCLPRFCRRHNLNYELVRRMLWRKWRRISEIEANAIEAITGIPVKKAGINVVYPRANRRKSFKKVR